jgi:hypothetical protein
LKTKTRKNRTIFGAFWRINSCPKNCKTRELLSIRYLVKGLKTRVFETKGGIGGFQMLIFDLFVKIFPKELSYRESNRTDISRQAKAPVSPRHTSAFPLSFIRS